VANRRVESIDICRGAGIILVVLGHILRGGPLRMWIYSFHMPLFFFLSGFVLTIPDRGKFATFSRRKLDRLVVPYGCFAVLGYTYWAIFERRFRSVGNEIPLWKPFLGIFYGVGTPQWMIFNIPLWYLPCLFLTLMVFVLVVLSVRRPKWIAVLIVCSSVAGYVIAGGKTSFVLPWGGSVALTALVFMGAGWFLRRSNVIMSIDRKTSMAIACIALAVNIPSALRNGSVDMNYLYLGNNYGLYYIAAISGIAFLFMFSATVQSSRFLSFLGHRSLGIMCLHAPIYRVLIGAAARLAHRPADVLRNSLLGSVSILAATLGASIGFSLLIEKYFPVALGNSPPGVKPSGILVDQHV
jgi:acyltransferase